MLQIVRTLDIDKIASLGRETYSQHFSDIWSGAGLENYLDSHFSPEILKAQLKIDLVQYYIPVFKKMAAGIVKIKLQSQIPSPPFDKGCELEKIYLLRKFTGMGLGKQILATAVELATEANEKFIWLDVLKNNAGAKKLYHSAGFDTVGEINFATDIQKIDMWIMRKQL
jgi:ribosomal protein S18 acetylase RimI-like enzyme